MSAITTEALHARVAASWALYVATRKSFAVVERIADATEIANKTSFAETFGSLQSDYGDLLYVRLSALFENARDNVTFSLPHLVRTIEMLPHNPKCRTIEFLTDFGIATTQSSKQACISFCRYEDDPHINTALQKLKDIRDKRIAHSERQPSAVLTGIDYDEAASLIERARRSIVLIATTFLDWRGRSNDEFGSVLGLERQDISRLIDAVAQCGNTGSRM